MMLLPKQKYIRNKSHRRFIASLPCLITGRDDVQSCHIRIENNAATALKSSDDCCAPLCIEQHRLQHEIGERAYWKPYLGHKRATKLTKALYGVTGDREAALELIEEWKAEREM